MQKSVRKLSTGQSQKSSLHNESNDNGVQLINLITDNLKYLSTIFSGSEIHEGSWI